MANQIGYTNSELAEMHLCYGFANGNNVAAAAEYARRYPNRRQPDRRIFSNIHRRLHESGQLQRRTPERDVRPGRHGRNVNIQFLFILKQL